jgi:hypothetical protein
VFGNGKYLLTDGFKRRVLKCTTCYAADSRAFGFGFALPEKTGAKSLISLRGMLCTARFSVNKSMQLPLSVKNGVRVCGGGSGGALLFADLTRKPDHRIYASLCMCFEQSVLRAKHLRSTFHIFLVNAFAGVYFKETDSDYGTS